MSDKNGQDFNFSEASYEDFLERFKTVEERVAYLEEVDRRMEFERKSDAIERKRDAIESRERWRQIDENLKQITQRLNHITKLTGIAFEELDFQNETLETAGKALGRKRKS